MLKTLFGTIWHGAPRGLRRVFSRITNQRFTVTAGGIVLDDQGRVLLLKHVFRPGSGWGIPGGFINSGEQPEAGLRRELREEVRMELDSAELAFVRLIEHLNQLEIVFRCRATGEPQPRSIEISEAGWFERAAFPEALSDDQLSQINRALSDGAKSQT